jgi:hypothetical protein
MGFSVLLLFVLIVVVKGNVVEASPRVFLVRVGKLGLVRNATVPVTLCGWAVDDMKWGREQPTKQHSASERREGCRGNVPLMRASGSSSSSSSEPR